MHSNNYIKLNQKEHSTLFKNYKKYIGKLIPWRKRKNNSWVNLIKTRNYRILRKSESKNKSESLIHNYKEKNQISI